MGKPGIRLFLMVVTGAVGCTGFVNSIRTGHNARSEQEGLGTGQQAGSKDGEPTPAAPAHTSTAIEEAEATGNAAEASAPEAQSTVARESPVSVPVPQRLAAWQSKLAEGFKVEAEKVVGGFGYAFARPVDDVNGEAIVVSQYGEIAGPFGSRSVGVGGLEVSAPALGGQRTRARHDGYGGLGRRRVD